MSSFVRAFLALSIFTAPAAFAAPVTKAVAVQAVHSSVTAYHLRRGPDNKHWVDRTLLPPTGTPRVAALKLAMEHEITGHANFTGADTPAFELISHGAAFTETLHGNKISPAAAHQTPSISLRASELAGGKLKATFLLPVSGHVGLAEARRYARSNVFEIRVNGRLTKVPARGFVTDHAMELSLKPGRNTITVEPYTSSLGGYVEGRTLHVDVL